MLKAENSHAAEDCAAVVEPTQIHTFEEYEEFSLENHAAVTVFCGAFERGEQPSLLKVLRQLGGSLGEEALRSTAFAWTEAHSNNEQGTGDLSGLFPGVTRCHLWPRRALRALASPAEQVSSVEFGEGLLEELAVKVSALLEAGVVDPFAQGAEMLIHYGAVDRAQIERDYPSLLEAMCGGAASCEVERRANLSREEFVNAYFLWGRPVIVTDAMESWPLMQTWTEEYLSERLQSFRSRRALSGESQLLNVADTAEQALLRSEYDVPYFFPRRGNRTVKLDSELFFTGEPRAKGITKHLDTGCHQYWVPHIRGVKRWTLWPVEARTEAAAAGRAPPFQFPRLTATLRPGEILVFYSGWWHETAYDVEPDSPTLSFTMYVGDIQPSFYLDEYRHELLSLDNYKNCMDLWFAPEAHVGHLLEKEAVG